MAPGTRRIFSAGRLHLGDFEDFAHLQKHVTAGTATALIMSPFISDASRLPCPTISRSYYIILYHHI